MADTRADDARDEAARRQDHAETQEAYYRRMNREEQNRRQSMARHKGQIQEASGGRSAAKHRADTDAGRGRGRALVNKPLGASPEGSAGTVEPDGLANQKAPDQSEDIDLEYLQEGLERPGTGDRVDARQRKNLALLRAQAERKDAEAGIGKQKPLPLDHPSVVAEIKHDQITRMMEEVPNQNKGNILEEEYNIGDPFDSDDDYID